MAHYVSIRRFKLAIHHPALWRFEKHAPVQDDSGDLGGLGVFPTPLVMFKGGLFKGMMFEKSVGALLCGLPSYSRTVDRAHPRKM